MKERQFCFSLRDRSHITSKLILDKLTNTSNNNPRFKKTLKTQPFIAAIKPFSAN